MVKRIKIAIQPDKGYYSDRWIEYCEHKNYCYKLVDCYKSDIIEQLQGCTHFLWNIQFFKMKDMLFAKQLLYSIENLGIKVFPNFHTMWHYDDKIGQKYLLESIGAPFVKTTIFYDKNQALEWVKNASYPFVFKLTGGASSKNVKLVKSRITAERLIKKAFSKGFNASVPSFRMKEGWRKFKKYRTLHFLRDTLAGLKNLLFPTHEQKLNKVLEKGYFYIQDFLPGNPFDIRIFVIGKRAVAIKRMVRRNDFRASGSGFVKFERKEIDERCVKIAFDVTQKLKAQALTFDFIYDQNNEPLIIEISYASVFKGYDKCDGYWDNNLNFIPGHLKAEYWMIEDLLEIDNE